MLKLLNTGCLSQPCYKQPVCTPACDRPAPPDPTDMVWEIMDGCVQLFLLGFPDIVSISCSAMRQIEITKQVADFTVDIIYDGTLERQE